MDLWIVVLLAVVLGMGEARDVRVVVDLGGVVVEESGSRLPVGDVLYE